MTHDELLAKIVEKEPGTLTYSNGEIWHSTRRLVSWQLALRAVVELHKPVLWQGIEMVCDGCGMDIEQNYNSGYPCPTIQAIEKELE